MPTSIAGSHRSSKNSYRAVADNAVIEEHLFGSLKKTSGKNSDIEIAIVGKDTVQVRKKFGCQSKRKEADAAVISASELHALQSQAQNLSKEESEEQQRRHAALQAERMEKSQARRAKMEDMEEERKKKTMASELDTEMEAQRSSVLEKAKAMLDEDNDDVKEMNKMVLYSKVVTVRDAQVQEKRYIQSERAFEEKQLDQMMELERLKALKMYEERNLKRADDQHRGAQIIIDQIKDRQVQRMQQEEHRDMERKFILQQISSIKDEEVEQQKQKVVASKKLMEEVEQANRTSMQIKDSKLIAERLEAQRVLKYQKNKELRARRAEEEKMAEKAKKEAEVDRMRGMQEKAADKAAEMDALRAKRANESAERAAREKEQHDKTRVEARNAELIQARKHQQQEKERRLAEQAKFERDEFERIIEVQMQQEDAERSRQVAEKRIRLAHCEELKDQIAAREEKALQDRRNALEQGNIVRAQLMVERRKLEKIKDKKISNLQKVGVPEKYWSELARKKISV
eukprot:GEMP01035976.1.p1 GENE.GEMP01035976.1~~GEMP01035976.1.p1  ORF type:complete len:515 (+),score=164.72 GEMP01035976.1:290-1834(+)